MDDRLKSLINALPALPEREDSSFDQLTDLVFVAEKLGMSEAVAHINNQLDWARKWYGPKPLHPEQRSGEIHLCNDDPDKVRYIGWKTKRTGEKAYDMEGNLVEGKVPVFVMAEEFATKNELTIRYPVAP